MTAPFEIQIQHDEVTAALARIGARLGNLTPAMEDIGRALGNLTEDSFQAEASPWGRGWERLSAPYVARPRNQGGRGGGAHPILQLAGGLAASITHGGDRQSAWVQASKKYAAIHQFGGLPGMAPGPRAIPPRPFMPVDAAGTLAPNAAAEILDILAEYLRP
jgi:phage virion morphogenesis protein